MREKEVKEPSEVQAVLMSRLQHTEEPMHVPSSNSPGFARYR